MNDVIRQLRERKSTRIFEEREIAKEVKGEIINAALEAPTAGNMLLYSILDITHPELKRELSITCDHQPFIAKAPLVLIFLADYQRWYDTFSTMGCQPRKPGPGDILLACADALIAAQNTVVAAHSLGLGSCYIGDILENGERVQELLDLPEFVLPAAMVVYGYPAESQKDRRKPVRFDGKYILHENQYGRLTKEEHYEMHRDRNERGGTQGKEVEEYIRAFFNRKYASDFALEMNRSANQYLKSFQD